MVAVKKLVVFAENVINRPAKTADLFAIGTVWFLIETIGAGPCDLRGRIDGH